METKWQMVRRVKWLYKKVANWILRAHKSLPVSWSLINHTHDHQKPGLTLSFSHSLATILCFTYSISQILFTQIDECKSTLWYMDYGHYVGWCTEGERRDQQPHSAPCQELLTHFLLEEIGSWREDSCPDKRGVLRPFWNLYALVQESMRGEKISGFLLLIFRVLLFSHPVITCSLWPYGLQHTRPPYPSPSPNVCPSSCPLH